MQKIIYEYTSNQSLQWKIDFYYQRAFDVVNKFLRNIYKLIPSLLKINREIDAKKN